MRIVTHNKNNRLQELKDLSLRRKHRKKKKLTVLSQNYFNQGNTKTMTKLLLTSLELTVIIIKKLEKI